MKRILIACEESDEVRSRFEAYGLDAWSCDLRPNRNPSAKHYQGNIFDIINDHWDAMIAFPPCTHLATSGAKHFDEKRKDGRQQKGIDFFMAMVNANIPMIAVENPQGIMNTVYRKPNQVIQPYYFGDPAQKTTCLWLKGFPPLYHNALPNLFDANVTHVDKGEMETMPSGKKMASWFVKSSHFNRTERAKIRSKTFPGIAQAMADQWHDLI